MKKKIPVSATKKLSGEMIKRMRIRAGLTQAALAESLGADQAHVARWESGKVVPSMTTFIQIAKVTHSPMYDDSNQ